MDDEKGNAGASMDLESGEVLVGGDFVTEKGVSGVGGTADDVSDSLESNKGSEKRWMAVAIVMTVLAVVLGGLLVWQMLTLRCDCKEEVTCETAQESDVSDTEVSQMGVEQDMAIREIVALVKEKTLELLDSNAEFLIDTHDVEVPYKPKGFLTPVQLNRGYGFELDRPRIDDSAEWYSKLYSINWGAELGHFLEGYGFIDTGEAYTTASAGPGDVPYYNEETGVVCAVTMEPWISCSYKDWYDKADAELSNELAKVFEAATGEEVEYLVAKVADIKDSLVTPYQRITVGRHGYGSMFYRVSPDAKWVYFTSGQDSPTCAEYNTEDLRKAFAGMKCWFDGDYAVVEP